MIFQVRVRVVGQCQLFLSNLLRGRERVPNESSWVMPAMTITMGDDNDYGVVS